MILSILENFMMCSIWFYMTILFIRLLVRVMYYLAKLREKKKMLPPKRPYYIYSL